MRYRLGDHVAMLKAGKVCRREIPFGWFIVGLNNVIASIKRPWLSAINKRTSSREGKRTLVANCVIYGRGDYGWDVDRNPTKGQLVGS